MLFGGLVLVLVMRFGFRVDRLIGSAIRGLGEVFLAEMHDWLSENARTCLDTLIESETVAEDADDTPDTTHSAFSLLKSDPGRIYRPGELVEYSLVSNPKRSTAASWVEENCPMFCAAKRPAELGLLTKAVSCSILDGDGSNVRNSNNRVMTLHGLLQSSS